MAIAKFCPAHWATMTHEEEAPYPAEGESCDFCGKPAARAAGHEPEPTPRGQLADGDREAWSLPGDAAMGSEPLEGEKVLTKFVARTSRRATS